MKRTCDPPRDLCQEPWGRWRIRCLTVPDETIWHEWDPFHQVLKVAFVDREKISEFTYRLCLNCGVSMELLDTPEGRTWTCDLCGGQVKESGEP